MQTLDEIIQLWKKDSEIDITEPSKEILNIPKIHSRFLTIMTDHRVASKKAIFKYNKLKRKKWEYYTGKMSQEELEAENWEPFRYTLKSDVTTYLESDKDLVDLLMSKSYHDECVSLCESILKELNNRTWQLREHMTHERFIQGAR
jgi:hypothetical protein